jgi:hypothetical protein
MAIYTSPTKECARCHKLFAKPPSCSRSEWQTRHSCSRSCSRLLVGNSWLRKFDFKPGVQSGTPFKSEQTTGSLNSKWKGDSASYAAKHMWIKYHYGKADHCEFCGTNEKRMYHWSNISGLYKRKRSDCSNYVCHVIAPSIRVRKEPSWLTHQSAY